MLLVGESAAAAEVAKLWLDTALKFLRCTGKASAFFSEEKEEKRVPSHL